MKLIPLDALVAEIERRKSEHLKRNNLCDDYYVQEDNAILSSINSLEVKEVDLEKEMNEALTHLTDKDMRGWFRYFFELGLKAQKGE